MNPKTVISIVVALVLLGSGVVIYVFYLQRETAVDKQPETFETEAAQEYHEARQKAGKFLVPDTKSRMRFDEEEAAAPTTSTPAR